MSNPERTRESGVQSVDRAISVLEILARRGEAGVSELAAELEVHKSTAFRLLGALEGRGLAEQIGDRGKYRLGFGLIPLAGRVSERLEVTQQARSMCEQLASELGETVNLAILDQGVAVNVDQARGPSTVTTYNWLGRITPLHSTSSGKVLLAAAEPEDREKLLVDLERTTPRTLVAPAKLAAELDGVTTQGFAWALEEYEVGLNAVAAPIRDHAGSVVAALSVSGPAYRLPPDRIEAITPDVVAGAMEISRRMGHWVH